MSEAQLALDVEETAAIEGECAVAQPGGGPPFRLRYRLRLDGAVPHGGELLPSGHLETLDVWEDGEWKAVRSLNGRDWFAVGLLAAQATEG